MSAVDSIILGIVQGLAEFLPISSKGHLVLAQKFLNFEVHDLAYDLVLHLATLLAIFAIFKKFLLHIIRDGVRALRTQKMNSAARMVLLVAVGTFPAGLIGLLFKDYFESLFGDMTVLGVGFLWTGLILLLTRRKKAPPVDLTVDHVDMLMKNFNQISYKQAFVVGCFQVLALLPGISRSGMTIAGGLFAGMNGVNASVFSFMISIPTIIGAAALKLKDVTNFSERLPEFSIGFITAFIFGIFGLKVVLAVVKRQRLEYFTVYVWGLALACLFFW